MNRQYFLIMLLTSFLLSGLLLNRVVNTQGAFLADKNFVSYEQATKSSKDIEETINILKAKFHKTYYGEGWLYYRIEVSNTFSSSLPNGVNVPKDFVWETWFYLSDQNLVEKHVSVQKTVTGEVLQLAVHSNNISWNKTFDEFFMLEPFSIGELDNNTLSSLLYYLDKNKHESKVLNVRGKKAIELTTLETYPNPVNLDGTGTKAVKIISESIYDEESGQLLSQESGWILDDGTKVPGGKTLVSMNRITEPPTWILDQLEEKNEKEENTKRAGKTLLKPMMSYSQKTVNSSVAGITTTSWKAVQVGEVEYSWDIKSSVPSSTPIHQIGYTWWTRQVKCSNGTYAYWAKTENKFWSGNVIQHSDFDRKTKTTVPCTSGSVQGQLGGLGNHHFVKDSFQDYPRNDVYYP